MTTPDQLQQRAAAALDQLAGALRVLRDRSPLSLRELAKATHVSDSALSRYFTGQALPPLEAVEALAELCGGDIGQLRCLWEDASAARRRVRRATAGDEPPAGTGAMAPLTEPAAESQAPKPVSGRREQVLRIAALAAGIIALIVVTSTVTHAWTLWSARSALAADSPGALSSPSASTPPSASTVPGSPAPTPGATPSATPSLPIAARPPAPPAPRHAAPVKPPAPAPKPKPEPSPADPAPAPDAPPVSTGVTLSIANAGSDPSAPYVVDVWNFATEPGSPVHLWSWRTNAFHSTQIWAQYRFAGHSGEARYQFRDTYSNLCLARGDQRNGGQLFQSSCDNSASQQWFLDSEGRLRSPADGRCLDVRDAIAEGSGLQMWDCETGRLQGWTFVPREREQQVS